MNREMDEEHVVNTLETVQPPNDLWNLVQLKASGTQNQPRRNGHFIALTSGIGGVLVVTGALVFGGIALSTRHQNAAPAGRASAPPVTATPTASHPAGTPVKVAIDTASEARASGHDSLITALPLSTHGTNELIVATVVGSSGNSGVTDAFTVSGGGLQWMLAGRSNVPLTTAAGVADYGSAEVWYAWAPAQLTDSLITAAGPNGSIQNGDIVVTAYHGVDLAQPIGAVQHAAASHASPVAITLTPTGNNSTITGSGYTPTRALFTPVSGETMPTRPVLSSMTLFVARIFNSTKGQPLTFGAAGPQVPAWNIVAVEIRAAHQ